MRTLRALACAVIAAIIIAGPITAGDAEADHIDGIMRGTEAALQAAHDDANPQCAAYADALMTVLGLVDAIGERPDSVYLPQLLTITLPTMAQTRNDCLLST